MPTSFVAQRFAHFGQSIFAEYTALAIKHNAINLAQGFPDFDGPDLAKQAAIAAIQAGHAQYAPMAGVPPLRAVLAAEYTRRGFGAVDPDSDVTVTCGCSEALTCCFAGLLNPGDEVVLFEPAFDFYAAGAAWAGAVPRFVTLHAPADDRADFTFDPAELRRAITPRTRVLVLNTPHNPTGKVFTPEELALIAQLCIEHDLVCISDEVYEHLIYPASPDRPAPAHVSIATLPGMRERTITLSSLGKTFSLTGWKVGWAIAPPALSAAVRAAHQFNTFSGATPMQHGAAAILREPGEHTARLRTLYPENRDALARALRDAGLRPLRSDSGYFLMADHAALSARLGLQGDRAFCEFLTREVGVAAIPPSVFYGLSTQGRTLARFAYCKKAQTIAQACERIRTRLAPQLRPPGP